MAAYTIRAATLADIPIITHHRRAMFTEMGLAGDYEGMAQQLAPWLEKNLNQTYFGWLVEAATGEVVAGGGVSLLPKPPGPQDLNQILAYVYNIYTEPAQRRQGLARQIMATIHQWCRRRNLKTVALHASDFGRPLYESLGYQATNEMKLTLEDP
jgi:GNAT superfamily N-acetyltransferase